MPPHFTVLALLSRDIGEMGSFASEMPEELSAQAEPQYPTQGHPRGCQQVLAEANIHL